MNDDDPVATTDEDLHAHVDGSLDPARLPAVLARLRQRPEDAERVLRWQAQRLQLRHLAQALAQDLARRPTPSALSEPVRRAARGRDRRRRWLQAAAVLLMVTAGVAGGRQWGRSEVGAAGLLASAGPAGTPEAAGAPGGVAAAQEARDIRAPRDTHPAGHNRDGEGRQGAHVANPPPFVREALAAHAVYVPETRHPVEVSAADEAHLLQWLSRRLGAPLKAPTLGRLGYQLLGGRLLPGDRCPRAQFMYEHPRGARVTLYVTVFDAAHPPETATFRTVRGPEGDSFYWVDDRLGYALSAQARNPDLQALAREVYAQLPR